MLTRFLGETVEHRVQHSTTRWHIANDACFAVRIKKREDERGRGVARGDGYQKLICFLNTSIFRLL
jgi:hypothetical protein